MFSSCGDDTTPGLRRAFAKITKCLIWGLPLFKAARPRQNAGMRLLVVEDDSKIASFVVRGLKEAGFAVDHAADGETGLSLAETTDHDAAIIDIMLPKLDGVSLVRRLRA